MAESRELPNPATRTVEEATSKWPGAIVILRPKGAGKTTICPAAFVFETPTGIAWVEPSYADPYGSSSPAYHARDGVPAGITEAGFVMPGENALAVVPYDRAEFDLVGDALDWFANWLKSEGRTWQEERERVRERVQRNWQ